MVLGDSVDDAYNKLKSIYDRIYPVDPVPYNINGYSSGEDTYYDGKVVYHYKPYSDNLTVYYHIAENGSGLFYFVDGLPLLSFSVMLDDITPESAWYERSYTFMTISHAGDNNRYLFLRMSIRPQGYDNYIYSGLYFEWGVMQYDFNAGTWKENYTLYHFEPLYTGTSLRIKEMYVYVAPTFYTYDSSDEKYLVFGFTCRVKTRAENETNLGHSFTVGEVPYIMIPLRSQTQNISIAKLEEKIKQLYGWKVFIGFGIRYVFSNQIAYDTLVDRASLPEDIILDFRIRNPSVFSILINAKKVNEYFELGVLTVLDEPVGRYQSNWTITSKETDLVAGILPIGIAFIPGVILRRYNKLGGALIFLGLATFLMYMMFQDVRIIILGAVSIASLFFIKMPEGGGIG